MNLTEYDAIVVNTSAGKDSLVMLAEVYRQAMLQGVRERVIAVHADLGRVEWQGTRELAERQARHFGVRFETVKRPQGDLLHHVEQRGMWPSSTTRYCTSDHKRDQVTKLLTRITAELQARCPGRPVRILNCLGIRAEESPARAKRAAFSLDQRSSNGKRRVYCWHPIFRITEAQVWKRIEEEGLSDLVHPAYKLGMPRLSCIFCIFAPKSALVLAGRHNPELLEEYVALEKRMGHTFRINLSLAEVKDAVQNGEEQEPVTTWTM